MNGWIDLICFIVDSEVNQYNRFYEELHSLGSGAFGEVFVVKWRYDGQEYAVKKIRFESNLMIFIYIYMNTPIQLCQHIDVMILSYIYL